MADKAVVTQTTLDAIGQAIIAKGGATAAMTPAQMPAAIQSIPSGGSGEWVIKPWRNDGKTHLWWHWENDFNIPTAVWSAQFVAPNGFTVDWGDGQIDTIAASTAFTARTLGHTYAEGGDHEVIVSGYESVKLMTERWFTSGNRTTGEYTSQPNVRQIEIVGVVTDNMNMALSGIYGCRAVKLDGATMLSHSLFFNCISMEEILFPNTVTSIGSQTFNNCNAKTIGDLSGVKTVGSLAFQNSQIETINLPSVESIQNSFYYCRKLRSIGDMPNLTSLGASACEGCSALETVGNISNIESIPSRIFHGCSSLASVDFSGRTSAELVAVTGFSNLPNSNQGNNTVYHCADGDFRKVNGALVQV